jgi:Ring finger domain
VSFCDFSILSKMERKKKLMLSLLRRGVQSQQTTNTVVENDDGGSNSLRILLVHVSLRPVARQDDIVDGAESSEVLASDNSEQDYEVFVTLYMPVQSGDAMPSASDIPGVTGSSSSSNLLAQLLNAALGNRIERGDHDDDSDRDGDDVVHGDAASDSAFHRLLNRLFLENAGGSAPQPASAAAIEALPTSVLADDDEHTDVERCVVCQYDFQVGDETTSLPCTHCFHRDCLIPWLETNRDCPLCRTPLQDDVQPQQQQQQQDNDEEEEVNDNVEQQEQEQDQAVDDIVAQQQQQQQQQQDDDNVRVRRVGIRRAMKRIRHRMSRLRRQLFRRRRRHHQRD